MVVRFLKFIPLIKEGGIKDEIHLLADQPAHMPMDKLGGIALGLTGNGLDAQLVNFPVGEGREHHPVAQFFEENGPERIILVHVQGPGNSHGASRGFVGGKGLIAEDPAQLKLKEIRHIVFVFLLSKAPLTAVAGYVLTPSRKTVDGQPAVIGAALTFGHAGLKLQVINFFEGEHGSLIALTEAFSGDQGGAESAHDSGNIGTDGLAFGNLFKAAQNRVVIKGASLHDDIFPQGGGIGNLDYLKEGVFDDRVSQTGRNIRHGGALLLRLLYLGIHKYGTPGAQVDGMLRKKGRFGKVLHGVVQGLGKGFYKGTAARGTGLVELYAVHGAVFDLNTFHILAADVQDTVYLRVKESGGIVMGYRFHLPVVQKESGFHQSFPVSGGAGADNRRILRKKGIDFPDGADGRL